MVMFRTLSLRAAADLARFMRQSTGGIDSNWPHLMMIGSPSQLAALVARHCDEQARRP
jgi:hypothetical protein